MGLRDAARAWGRDRRAEWLLDVLRRVSDPGAALLHYRGSVDDRVVDGLLALSQSARRTPDLAEADRWAGLAVEAATIGGGKSRLADALGWQVTVRLDRHYESPDRPLPGAVVEMAERCLRLQTEMASGAGIAQARDLLARARAAATEPTASPPTALPRTMVSSIGPSEPLSSGPAEPSSSDAPAARGATGSERPTVFVSYSSRDKDFVRKLVADLGRVDIDAWQDERELRVGEDLAAIRLAIGAARFLVIVVSRAAAGSAWVEREVELAAELGIPILPVLLQDVSDAWLARFADLAHADFRRRQDYRRATYRLVAAIQGTSDRMRFLRAKEAVAMVRAQEGPTGVLFGISQQGIAMLYSLANLRDWEFADATDGASRFWIVEFYDSRTGRIDTYAVMDSTIHHLPETYVYGTDLAPGNSIITYSTALNHLPGLSEEEAAAFVAEHQDKMTTISRRYVPFRPAPLVDQFVDSTAAVNAAVDSAYGQADVDDLFILTKLECDKRNQELPTWIVSFFDPTLADSVITVGVDAGTGAVRYPRMRSEILNADFFSTRLDEKTGGITISIANQFRAMESHIWDVPVPSTSSVRPGPARITAAEALESAAQLLRSQPEQRSWQLFHLSNTGVVDTAVAYAENPNDRLMNRQGAAGQWVVEVCGNEPTPVTDGEQCGYGYPYKRILCTPGDTYVDHSKALLPMLKPLSDTPPLPDRLIECFEHARELAIRNVRVDFVAMSVATMRREPEACWFFRFYDDTEIIARVTISGDGRRVVD